MSLGIRGVDNSIAIYIDLSLDNIIFSRDDMCFPILDMIKCLLKLLASCFSNVSILESNRFVVRCGLRFALL